MLSTNSSLISHLLPAAIHSARVKAHAERGDPVRSFAQGTYPDRDGKLGDPQHVSSGQRRPEQSDVHVGSHPRARRDAPEPIFASNGTGAAGTTTVVFGMAGSYRFTVTAGDVSGRKATRAVNLKVQFYAP